MASLSEEAVLEEINRSNRSYPVSEDYHRRELTHPIEDTTKSYPRVLSSKKTTTNNRKPTEDTNWHYARGNSRGYKQAYIRRIQQRTQSDTTPEFGNENNMGSFFLVGTGNLLFKPSKTLFIKKDSVSEITLTMCSWNTLKSLISRIQTGILLHQAR